MRYWGARVRGYSRVTTLAMGREGGFVRRFAIQLLSCASSSGFESKAHVAAPRRAPTRDEPAAIAAKSSCPPPMNSTSKRRDTEKTPARTSSGAARRFGFMRDIATICCNGRSRCKILNGKAAAIAVVSLYCWTPVRFATAYGSLLATTRTVPTTSHCGGRI